MNLLNPVASKRRYMQVAEESREQKCDIDWMPNGLVTHNVGYGVVSSLSLSLSLFHCCAVRLRLKNQQALGVYSVIKIQPWLTAESRLSVD